EGPLELRLDREQPVEVVRIAVLLAERAHRLDAVHHAARDFGGIVDDDAETLRRRLAERAGNEAADVLEICATLPRACQNHGQRLLRVRGIEHNAEKVQDLLGGTGAAREHHDAVRDTHERFEALLDVRHDHQLADDRVRRLGRDDAGLGDADVAPVLDALLGMPDGCAPLRPLHGARPAAGTDIETAQAHLVAYALAVLVLLAADRVAAPAHDQVRTGLVIEEAGVAQYVKNGVRDRGGVAQVETAARHDLVGDEDHVPEHGEEVLLDAADHLPVDEGAARGVVHLELDAPRMAHDTDIEVAVAVEDLLGVVGGGAAVQHRQRALAEERVEPALPGVQELLDLRL